MASNMPVRNKAIADQQRAARMLQLQQTVAGMSPQQAPTKAQAAGMGAAMAETAGKQQIATAEQSLQTAGQMAKLGQAETAQAGAERMGALTEGARKEALDQTQRLANLDQRAKQELFDKELTIRKDAADDALFTERQLADYAVRSAKKAEDFKARQQKSEQLHARNIKILEAVDARLTQALKQGYLDNKQKLDQASREEVAKIQAENRRRLADAKAKAANTAMMWGAAGSLLTIAGTAAMFVPGGQVAGVGLMAAGAGATGYGQQQAAKQAGEV